MSQTLDALSSPKWERMLQKGRDIERERVGSLPDEIVRERFLMAVARELPWLEPEHTSLKYLTITNLTTEKEIEIRILNLAPIRVSFARDNYQDLVWSMRAYHLGYKGKPAFFRIPLLSGDVFAPTPEEALALAEKNRVQWERSLEAKLGVVQTDSDDDVA